MHVFVLINYRDTIDNNPYIEGVYTTRTSAQRRAVKLDLSNSNYAILKMSIKGVLSYRAITDYGKVNISLS